MTTKIHSSTSELAEGLYGTIMTHKKSYNDIINMTLEYTIDVQYWIDNGYKDITLTNKETKKVLYGEALPFGYLQNNTFNWISDILKAFKNSIVNKEMIEDFGEHRDIIDYLFTEHVDFDEKNREIVPIFISIITNYIVIRFSKNENDNNYQYLLIKCPDFVIPEKIIEEKDTIIGMMRIYLKMHMNNHKDDEKGINIPKHIFKKN
jgi:uncharacterized protein YsxB (DUF464 family)